MRNLLNTKNLAKENIKRKPFRTASLIIMTGILAFTLLMSSFMLSSLKTGMESLSDRLGADVIVVPQGYDSKIQGALLRGEPNSFYFDKSVLERLEGIDGVEKATPQLFIATLSASCCSAPLQIIGIDFESDFLVKSWLQEQVDLPLGEDEIIVGKNIVGNYDGTLKFFMKPFIIKGRLAPTGMGFDNSVFMSIKDARELSKEAERILQSKIADNENLISSVMIRKSQDIEAKELARRIREEFKGEQVYPLISKNMMSEINSSISGLYIYFYVVIGVIWILSFIILMIMFSATLNERKREMGMLRIIGANKKYLSNLFLTESLYISVIGSLIGTVFALVSFVLFSAAISSSLNLPFLMPSYIYIGVLSVVVFVISSMIGPLSSLYGARKMAKQELGLVFKEND